jgi:hypothetical protein
MRGLKLRSKCLIKITILTKEPGAMKPIQSVWGRAGVLPGVRGYKL